MTEFRLYNSLTRREEPFQPLDPGHVRIYACGPTVYDYAHIGNARMVVVFDLLVSILRRLHPRVTYARNITDIDDKIMARAAETGRSIGEITAQYTRAFQQDMAALGCAPPDHEPAATAYVPEMLDLIARLIGRGHAYAAEGHVLFDVPSNPRFGRLSGRDREEQIAGARVEVAPYKRDPADFILWKPSGPDQPGWDSPYGRGRPGWHLECSAMSEALLGLPFDIHGGGIDLLFPHHENEIAQSCCATGLPDMARFWVHNGFVMVEGQKMSKSLGNFITAHDLLQRIPGEAIRLTLLSAQYRQPLDFTEDRLQQARDLLTRLYTALEQGGAPEASAAAPDPALWAAMLDDMNTPQALARLHELIAAVFRAESAPARAEAAAVLKASAGLMGLGSQAPEAWLRGSVAGLEESAILEAIAARQAARRARNFAEADRIRQDLLNQGVVLEDGPGGTVWRRA